MKDLNQISHSSFLSLRLTRNYCNFTFLHSFFRFILMFFLLFALNLTKFFYVFVISLTIRIFLIFYCYSIIRVFLFSFIWKFIFFEFPLMKILLIQVLFFKMKYINNFEKYLFISHIFFISFCSAHFFSSFFKFFFLFSYSSFFAFFECSF